MSEDTFEANLAEIESALRGWPRDHLVALLAVVEGELADREERDRQRELRRRAAQAVLPVGDRD